MPSGTHHLGDDERCQIFALKKRGLSFREIGRELGRSAATICREYRRNQGRRGYRHKQAQCLAESRRQAAVSGPRKLTPEIWEQVVTLLTSRQLSPEQLTGRLALEGIVDISASWIDRMLWKDRREGGKLYRHLRRRGKQANRRGKERAGRGVIPDRVDIQARPAVVDLKSRLGDWELDTIVGARHQGAVVTLVDRCSKLVLLHPVARRTASAVSQAIIDKLLPWKDRCWTLTADNGKEFAGHREVSSALGADCYFAAPYHSWERGLNEHSNGLLRQDWPKGMNLRELRLSEVQRVEDLLNHRPRKVLGYKTPWEVFHRAPVTRLLCAT